MVIYRGDHTQDIIRISICLNQRGTIFGTPADIEKAYICFSREIFGVNWKTLSTDLTERFTEWLDGRDISEETR